MIDGVPVSIFTVSFAEFEPPALSETEHDTGCDPSPDTENVHGPDPPRVTADPSFVQEGAPVRPVPEVSVAVRV